MVNGKYCCTHATFTGTFSDETTTQVPSDASCLDRCPMIHPLAAQDATAQKSPATADYRAQVTKAVEFLRTQQAEDGSFSAQTGVGPTALVAAALLSVDVPAQDRSFRILWLTCSSMCRPMAASMPMVRVTRITTRVLQWSHCRAPTKMASTASS